MLTPKCIYEYRKQYPQDRCFYMEPSDIVIIINNKDKKYRQDIKETDIEFFDRLERSKKTGENLFYKEWEKFDFIEGVDY